jgi:hypothetical protein
VACFYSDTDSCFIQYPLPPALVGSELGQFKDELNGDIIIEAYFLGDKFYGYKTNSTVKVVVAGLPTIKVDNKKTSAITFSDLIAIWNGATRQYTRSTIIKRLSELSLYNSTSTITMELSPHDSKKC